MGCAASASSHNAKGRPATVAIPQRRALDDGCTAVAQAPPASAGEPPVQPNRQPRAVAVAAGAIDSVPSLPPCSNSSRLREVEQVVVMRQQSVSTAASDAGAKSRLVLSDACSAEQAQAGSSALSSPNSSRARVQEEIIPPKWVTQRTLDEVPFTWSNSCDRLGALLLAEEGSQWSTDRDACRDHAREYYKNACGQRCEMSARKLHRLVEKERERLANVALEQQRKEREAQGQLAGKAVQEPLSYASTKAPASYDRDQRGPPSWDPPQQLEQEALAHNQHVQRSYA